MTQKDTKECKLDHCHDCAKCGYERPMTNGEAEIASSLDEYFEKKDTKEWKERFNEKFARKNIETQQYVDNWFVKETITSGAIKNFIEVELLKAQQSAVESYKKELVERLPHYEMEHPYLIEKIESEGDFLWFKVNPKKLSTDRLKIIDGDKDFNSCLEKVKSLINGK